MMLPMGDFVWEGEDNFFEAMHHMSMVLKESDHACGGRVDLVPEGCSLPHDMRRSGDVLVLNDGS